MSDTDSKLDSLTLVQKLFPNDDLGLLEPLNVNTKNNESPSFRQFVTDTKNSWSSMQRKHKNEKLNPGIPVEFVTGEVQSKPFLNVRNFFIFYFILNSTKAYVNHLIIYWYLSIGLILS